MKFYLSFGPNPLRLFGDSGVFIGLLLLVIVTALTGIFGYVKKDYSYFKKELKVLLIFAIIIVLFFLFLIFDKISKS